MLHSILITGGTQNQRLEKLTNLLKTDLKPRPDLLILDPDPSITIKQIRSLEVFLSKKAYQADFKLVVISQADKLTLPAQNAILKTLEEPPLNSKIVLLSATKQQLIPTIISRCQLINLTSDFTLSNPIKKEQKTIFQKIAKASTSQRITLASTYGKSKDSSIEFLKLQLLLLKKDIIMHPELIKKIITAINQLKANVNPKLVLEVLFYYYPEKA